MNKTKRRKMEVCMNSSVLRDHNSLHGHLNENKSENLTYVRVMTGWYPLRDNVPCRRSHHPVEGLARDDSRPASHGTWKHSVQRARSFFSDKKVE